MCGLESCIIAHSLLRPANCYDRLADMQLGWRSECSCATHMWRYTTQMHGWVRVIAGIWNCWEGGSDARAVELLSPCGIGDVIRYVFGISYNGIQFMLAIFRAPL